MCPHAWSSTSPEQDRPPREPPAGAPGPSTLALAGFLTGSAFVGLVTVVMTGSALAEPGGWLALGLTCAWVLPLAGLVLLGLLRPAAATVLLTVLIVGPLGFGVWNLLDHSGAHAWEDAHGPVSLVLLIVVAAGVVPLGLSRPRLAGGLLVAATAVPAVSGIVGAGDDWARELAIQAVTVPLVIAGVLFLLAGRDAEATIPREHR